MLPGVFILAEAFMHPVQIHEMQRINVAKNIIASSGDSFTKFVVPNLEHAAKNPSIKKIKMSASNAVSNLLDGAYNKSADEMNIIISSLVYKKVEDSTEFSKCKKLVVDNLNCVQKIYEDQKSSRANILLDTMVIDKTLLLELLVKSSQISAMINVESMVGYLVNFVTRVNAIEFTGFVRFFDSLEHYFKYSLELLNNPEVLREFFQDPEWIYYTTTHNSHPVLYGPNANVTNSLVANGTNIEGTVKNSIISRDVTVEEGAIVENSIIFTHTTIKRGVHLKNVIADKRTIFENKKDVYGTESHPLYFPRGVIV